MSKINILDKHTAELIAAGEVVDRPASVIKELVENSIDAGASAITVEIKNGGTTFMRVTDNGSGIEYEDIKNAFLRHATSKIKTENDLNSILTLGFRGEALASISAVAKVELLTRTEKSEFGYKYVIHGGQEIDFLEAGCAVGTTIVVKDLFYNTPARQKFLKKDFTEANAVAAIVERIAISHPEVSIKFIKDSQQIINTPGDCNLKNAIFSVFGKEFVQGLLAVDYNLNGVAVNGFITKPSFSRRNRNMQFFILNGRFIKTKTGIAALEQAYKNEIMIGKFPACVVNININPETVDVNVHPTKLEVRFADENCVFKAIYYAVKSALLADEERVQFQQPKQVKIEDSQDFLQTKIDFKADNQPLFKDSFSYSYKLKDSADEQQKDSAETVINNNAQTVEKEIDTAKFNITFKNDNNDNNIEIIKEEVQSLQQPLDENINKADKTIEIKNNAENIDFKFIGEAFDTYIIVEYNDQLTLIDKHAAHEKIIFERLKKQSNLMPQLLLTPAVITLPAVDYELIVSNLEKINSLGFEVEDYGANTVIVRSLPMDLDGKDANELLLEMAGKLNDKFTDISPEFLDWLYHSVACRAAIKAGNHSSEEELISLARQVLNDNNIRHCPHGRPVAADLTLNEIKRRFSRT